MKHIGILIKLGFLHVKAHLQELVPWLEEPRRYTFAGP